MYEEDDNNPFRQTPLGEIWGEQKPPQPPIPDGYEFAPHPLDAIVGGTAVPRGMDAQFMRPTGTNEPPVMHPAYREPYRQKLGFAPGMGPDWLETPLKTPATQRVRAPLDQYAQAGGDGEAQTHLQKSSLPAVPGEARNQEATPTAYPPSAPDEFNGMGANRSRPRVKLEYDGKTLRWLENGTPRLSFPAWSGSQYFSDPKWQWKSWYGPIPEGVYDLHQQDLQWYDLPEMGKDMFRIWGQGKKTNWQGGLRSWGAGRVWLRPRSETNTYGRSGFTIHGGDEPGSAGCIDLTDRAQEFLKEFQRHGEDAELHVRYSR